LIGDIPWGIGYSSEEFGLETYHGALVIVLRSLDWRHTMWHWL
jgi:hypothetical protein